MVSPYLSRPLRSLREALGSRDAASERNSEARDSRPAKPDTAAPLEANPLIPPLTPRQPFTVVTGGAAGAPERNDPRRDRPVT